MYFSFVIVTAWTGRQSEVAGPRPGEHDRTRRSGRAPGDRPRPDGCVLRGRDRAGAPRPGGPRRRQPPAGPPRGARSSGPQAGRDGTLSYGVSRALAGGARRHPRPDRGGVRASTAPPTTASARRSPSRTPRTTGSRCPATGEGRRGDRDGRVGRRKGIVETVGTRLGVDGWDRRLQRGRRHCSLWRTHRQQDGGDGRRRPGRRCRSRRPYGVRPAIRSADAGCRRW